MVHILHPIPSFPKYEITRAGNIFNAKTGYKLRSYNGYVSLYDCGKRFHVKVSDLLKITFKPKRSYNWFEKILIKSGLYDNK